MEVRGQMFTADQQQEAARTAADIIGLLKRHQQDVAILAIINTVALTLRFSAPNYSSAKRSLDALAAGIEERTRQLFDQPLPPGAN